MTYTDNDKVNLLEWQLNDTNRFEEYKLFLSGAVESSNERTINNVRYSMALADSHNQINAGNQYMFIGGMGVLGNIVRHLGEYSAVNWRDSHDMDILCRNRQYSFLYGNFFDRTEVASKSLSFGNKLCYRGSSKDIEEKFLDETNMDIYVPGPKRGMDIIVNKTIFNDRHWKNSKLVDYFGIKMRIADPITLIGMKLDVDENVNPVRRSKDLSDIIALLGVIERDGIRSEDIKIKLNESQFRNIGNILHEYPEHNMNGKKGYILMPSLEYAQEIIKLGEEK
tara:strand:- start:5 stop:847 length:843 start_codon:yes stop_codon:yes gene_type:complete